MIRVPADGTRDVQGDLREEGQQRGDLVAHDLGGVIVAVVHQRDAFVAVHGGVGESELRAAHGVSLHADAEDLRFDAGLDLVEVEGFGQDRVDRRAVALARPHAVGGHVLEAVAGPDVHHALFAQLLGQVRRDADAGLPVLDPELARLLVRRGKRQRVALGVGEEGGVEVAAQAPRLAEVHPLLKMLRLEPVAVRPLALVEDRVAGVQVQLRPAGDEGQHLVEVGHQLLGRAGAAGVVAGGLDAAGQRRVGIGVEAAHIVALPAVEGDGDGLQPLDRGVRVHAEKGVFLFCFGVAHLSASICIFRFPIAVASMGRAITFLPVAFSVSSFRNAFFAPPPTM